MSAMIGALLFGATLLLIDQGSKRLAEVHASARPIACGRFLKIRSIANPQTTLPRVHPRIIFPVLWMIALLCAVLLYTWGGWFHSKVALWGLGLAFSGAAGNLVDLLRREFILDFIDLGWWPVFNVADAGIVAGLVLAFWPRG
jgi:signal peptidase II